MYTDSYCNLAFCCKSMELNDYYYYFLADLRFPYVHISMIATCKRYHFDTCTGTIRIHVSLMIKFMYKGQTLRDVLLEKGQSQLLKTIVCFMSMSMSKKGGKTVWMATKCPPENVFRVKHQQSTYALLAENRCVIVRGVHMQP